ncbi:L,D-transpeptidase ErfK/SrfK [Halomonas fontilapidosi]|uniref:L,D-transpeptidase ErfK/SrfK n=1 Tax=Halomonas fontilapidosi TaxID=616675 RepID=A0A7W5DHB9_9GAMM|nr:L,D-transpeptidase family protein [Halomonas fontilapidosi]MBB3182954.1 L,D-transpeptidase ErfK/SrfK [Halomonas fontilapidosi]
MTHSFPLGRTARFASALALCAALATPLQANSEEWPRGYYPLPEEGDLVGEVYRVVAESGDTLIDIGHEHGIGYEEMVRANPGVSIWAPFEGTEVVIPGRFILPDEPREGLVVNVAEMRLYYYPPSDDGETPRVETYPIAVGRMDWKTPLGTTRITEKVKNPAWYPPASIRREHAEAGDPLPSVVPPGPDNPMGTRKMRLGIPGYLIHGTNRPEGVGMRVTHGCIRMLPEDIEALFPRLPTGTQVKLINETLKLGWSDGTLHVQAYPYLDEEDGTTIQRITEALDQVDMATDGLDYPVDYARLREVVEVPRGMPVALEVSAPEPAPETLWDRLELIAADTESLENQPEES